MSTLSTDAKPDEDKPLMDNPHAGCVRQVMVVRFRRNLPQPQIEGIEMHFRSLAAKVGGVRDLEWGTDISQERLGDHFSHCFAITFDDPAARDAWVNHKSRQGFMALLKPKVDRLIVLDYVITR